MLSEMLTPEEARRLYETAFSVQVPGLEIVTGDPIASQMRRQQSEDLGNTPVGGCAAGVSGLTLLPDGTITPCRRLPIPVGNVRSDRLREVWATSDVLARLRNRNLYSSSCGRCPRWAECRGCRAIAYAYAQLQGHDDYLGPDPQCFVENRV